MEIVQGREWLPYYHNARPEVQPFVPQGVRRLLDVGCGAGAFGLVYKKLGAEVWGLELEPEVAALAAEKLDHVRAGDAVAHIRDLPEGHFDVVTCFDVLEHLAWPGELLAGARRVLRPGGCVVASLPNLRYWPAFRRLALRGEFPREDSGIFDRTHLRWFTEKAVGEFFASEGWRVEALQGINPCSNRSLRVLNLLTRGKFADCRYLQFAVRAVPA